MDLQALAAPIAGPWVRRSSSERQLGGLLALHHADAVCSLVRGSAGPETYVPCIHDVHSHRYPSNSRLLVACGGVFAGIVGQRLGVPRLRREQRLGQIKRCVRTFTSRAATSSQVQEDKVVMTFLNWADELGVTFSKKLLITAPDVDGPDQIGRGRRVVVAAESGGVNEDELLVTLPVDATVSVELAEDSDPPTGMEDLRGWWAKHTKSSLRIAAALAWKREGFAPYFNMLPALDEIDAPWRWADEELEILSPALAAKSKARRAAVEAACNDLEAEGLSDRVPLDSFLQAHHAATSRAFTGEGPDGILPFVGGGGLIAAIGTATAVGAIDVQSGLLAGGVALLACGSLGVLSSKKQILSILPVVDQVNHANGPPPRLVIDPIAKCWELRSERRYEPGEEIVFSYGDKDTDLLLLQHGFVETDNSVDMLELPIPLQDLSSDTRAALEAKGVGMVQFLRGGAAKLITASGEAAEPEVVTAEGLTEVARSALRAELDAAWDEDAAKQTMKSASKERLVLAWRRERDRLTQEAAKYWKL